MYFERRWANQSRVCIGAPGASKRRFSAANQHKTASYGLIAQTQNALTKNDGVTQSTYSNVDTGKDFVTLQNGVTACVCNTSRSTDLIDLSFQERGRGNQVVNRWKSSSNGRLKRNSIDTCTGCFVEQSAKLVQPVKLSNK